MEYMKRIFIQAFVSMEPLEQLFPVFIHLPDRVHDVVHVGTSGQQHVLVEPQRFPGEAVVVGQIVQFLAVAVQPSFRKRRL
jgi:hypothetical protein